MREDADGDEWVTVYDESTLDGSSIGGNNIGGTAGNKGADDNNDDSNNEYESDQWDDSSIEEQESLHNATAKIIRYTHQYTSHAYIRTSLYNTVTN